MNGRPVVVLYHARTEHERNYRDFWTPYSVLNVAAVLDRTRYEIMIFDNNLEQRTNFAEILSPIADRLLCVGISAMIGHQIADGMRFALAVREVAESVPIVWGGPLPTVLPRETLSSSLVDFIVRGQGETPFKHIVDSLNEGDEVTAIPGIGYKIGKELFEGTQRRLEDLNVFPPPPLDLIDASRYIRHDEHIATRTMSYHSSQGCPFNCGFCAETALWENKWSSLRAERVVGEIANMVTEYGINGIKFYDSEFFIDKRRALQIARLLSTGDHDVKWAASVHPRNADRLSNDDLLLLTDSGLSRLLIGAESGVQDEIDLVGKRTNCDMIRRIAERYADFNIHVCFTFVTGYPGSPSSAIGDSLRFAEELRAIGPMHEIKMHFYGPYPGTPLWPLALRHGFAPPTSLEEWSRFDYYDIVTPWIDSSYGPVLREFNERHYPYLHPLAAS